ncbi:hypothetical protein H0H92_000754 [Tricholoma furcatifolium]|nr:hypothetical protein H0H92_000754 [Tricholoma furcatifolium]
MPSLRNLFIATTAFLALTSAAPTRRAITDAVAGVQDEAANVVNAVVPSLPIPAVAPASQKRTVDTTVTDIINDIEAKVPVQVPSSAVAAPAKRQLGNDTQLPSLPAILSDTKTKLAAVATTLNGLLSGANSTGIGSEALQAVVQDVTGILTTALDNTKAIVGQPVDTVLALDGQVLSAFDVSTLIVGVLNEITNILGVVVKLAESLPVVGSLVSAAASVLTQLLSVIFNDLNAGLLSAIDPLITPVVSAVLSALGLSDVMSLLQL